MLRSFTCLVLTLQADAAALPLDTQSADTVVDTFSLCVMSSPREVLSEMARVVKPGGRVLLLEHARSNNAALGWYQGLTAQAVAASAKGCDWSQDVPQLCQQAGLQIVRMSRHLAGTVCMIEAVPAHAPLAFKH
jgi:methyltransferase OMS1